MIKDPIRIIVTDDKAKFRHLIVSELLDYNILTISEAGNGRELLQQLEKAEPDVVLLDLRMPEMDGNDTLTHLSKKYPQLKIIIISNYYNHELKMDYARRGVKGYISKDDFTGDMEELVLAIRKVHRGGKYIHNSGDAESLNFTERQRDIIYWDAQGLSKKEIGVKLQITESGVAKQQKKIMQKMDVVTPSAYYNYIAHAGFAFLRKPLTYNSED